MKKQNTWLCLLLCQSCLYLLLVRHGFSQTTYTPTITTPTVNWSCGNEHLSISDYNFIATQNNTFRSASTSGPYLIPVVVHVLYDAAHANDPAFNISYKQIEWQISQLNMGSLNQLNSTETRATNTQIRFCLAQIASGATWTNNNEKGVMRYQVPTSALSHTIDVPNKNGILSITNVPTAFPFENYLNIFLVNEIIDTTGVAAGGLPNTNVIGYANFPNTLSASNPLDGIVIRQDVFGSNYIPNNQNILMAQLDKGNVLTHEVGHYLNLLHTFTGGCVGTNSATCNTQGDLICDTPPTSIDNTTMCYGYSSCVDNLPAYSGVNQFDMFSNFMSYTDDDCLKTFTIDQADVMQGVMSTAWPTGRADLSSSANLIATGLLSPSVCCATGVVTAFYTTTVSCTSASFTCHVPECSLNDTYYWQFGDGTTLTTALSSVTHTYLAGQYTPTLTVTGSNGAVEVYSSPIKVGSFGHSSAKYICNNSYQGINFHIENAISGTYSLSAIFSNGTTASHTYSVNPNMQLYLGHTGSEDIEYHLPVNLSSTVTLPAQIIYTITLSGTTICPTTYIDTFFVSDCCNTLITNGDFSNGTNGFTSQVLYPNVEVGNPPAWLLWPFNPSLKFDSPRCGVPSTCTVIELYNSAFPLASGNNYHLNFQCFGGNPAYLFTNNHRFFMDTMLFNVRILDNSGNTLHNFGTFPVMDLMDTTWHHYDFMFNNPSYNGTGRVSISSIKNFYSEDWVNYYNDPTWPSYMGWDYNIDEVSIRAVNPGYTVSTSPTNTMICAYHPATITSTASATSTYSWSNGATTSSITITPATTTVYTVTATSALNCTATAQSTVTVNSLPNLTITPTSSAICSGQTLTLSVSGADTYLWNTGATSSVLIVSPGSTTIYSVTGTYTSTGCPITSTIGIIVNPKPTLTISPNSPTVCLGQATVLTASGANTYSWSNGATTSTVSVGPLVNTTYTVIGTNTLTGCSNSSTIQVTVLPNPTVSISNTTICAGQSTTLNASGATSYSWNTGATTSTLSVSPATTTVYTVTGTTNGCSNTKTVSVTVTPNPTVSVSNATICAGSSTVLTASGATTYSWNTGATTSTISVNPSATTVYTVTGTSNSCSNTKTVSVTVTPNPTVSVSNATICIGSSTVLTAGGATTYSWSTGATTSTISVSPTVTTVYTVTGTTNSCSNTKTVSVTVNALPSLSITPSATTICSGSSTTLTASGANTYTWNTGPTTASISVSPATTTIYTVTGRNSTTGCSNTKTVSVTVNPTPTVTATASPTSICVGQSSTLTAGGATTYSWSTGVTTTTTTVSPSVTTVYTVTGTSSGCSSTKTVSVIVGPITPTLTASSTSVTVCGSGTATLTATGATNYTWMPGSIYTATASVSPSAATVYTLSGSYGTGCGTSTVSLLVNPVISTLCCSAANTVISTSTITAGTYNNPGTVVDVQGVITFTGNTSFTGYTFRMAPGALIRVVGEYTLSLTNCKLFSCSELWSGIELVASSYDKHAHATFSATTVEDMYNGVYMNGNGYAIKWPINDIIKSTGSTFNKNYMSFQMKNIDGMVTLSPTTYTNVPYPFTMRTTTITSYSSITSPGSALKPSSTYTYAYNTITNGTMGGSAPYLNFPRAFTGINLENLRYSSAFIVGDQSNSAYTNTFDNLDLGINGSEVQVNVHNNYFKNITGSAKQGDITTVPAVYYAAGPDEIGVAVAITNTTANTYDLKVGNSTTAVTSNPYPVGNKFEDCNRAVKSINNKALYVRANTFTATSTSTPVVTTSGSPPFQFISPNPDTYYYYNAQSAVFASGVTYLADASYNYIRNYGTGIYINYTSNSDVATVKSYTNDIAAPSSTGYCMQAIQIDQSGGFTNSDVAIIGNSIASAYRGIAANSVKNQLRILQSNITIEDVTKTLNYSATSQRTGISMSNCDYGQIQGNTITSNAASIPSTSTSATYLTGVSVNASPNCKVECNLASHLGRGFVFQGACGGSSWKVNTMQDSYRGLEMRLSAVIGSQGATSGTPNLSANTWTTVTEETYVLATNPNVTSILFLKSNIGGSPKTEPTLNFGTNGYSALAGGIVITTGTSYTCNAGVAQRLANANGNTDSNNNNSMRMSSGGADSLNQYARLASADESDYEVFAEEMMHQNKQWVYKLIKQDSIHPLEGSTLNTFFEASEQTAIDKLTEAELAIGRFEVDAATAANNSAPVTNATEQKHQTANDLLLKYMNNRNYQFTDAEKADLYAMASECPVKGSYVSCSRNLINAMIHDVIIYEDNCDAELNNSRKAKMNETDTQASFNLFPNPNNGNMQLDYDLALYNNADMNLYDVTGKLVKSYKLENTKGSIQINEQNLYNGVYFYRILANDRIIKTDKIVIIK